MDSAAEDCSTVSWAGGAAVPHSWLSWSATSITIGFVVIVTIVNEFGANPSTPVSSSHQNSLQVDVHPQIFGIGFDLLIHTYQEACRIEPTKFYLRIDAEAKG